jgi:hypothetical protein
MREQSRVRLLCGTDYQALLKAGRAVLSRTPMPEPGPDGSRLAGTFPVPDGVSIPRPIRWISPYSAAVDYNGFLIVELGSGRDRFGVRIYPGGFKTPHSTFSYGDLRLSDGLWYYDEGYRGSTSYQGRIDRLIKENKWSVLNTAWRHMGSLEAVLTISLAVLAALLVVLLATGRKTPDTPPPQVAGQMGQASIPVGEGRQ